MKFNQSVVRVVAVVVAAVLLTLCASVLILDSRSTAAPTSIALDTWSVVQFDFRGINASWILSEGNTVATQVINSDPSVLLSDFDATDLQLSGTFSVQTSGDDDFIGFVFGFQDTRHFYLFDWKQLGQSTFCPRGPTGMTVKVVDADAPLDCVDWASDTGVFQVLRSNTVGWEDFVEYRFTLQFVSGFFTIEVANATSGQVLEFWQIEDDTYSSGKFGFYNFSQPNVRYTGFTSEPACASEPIQETRFDTGLDGWALVDVDNEPADGSVSWQSSGGNPDGYALFDDDPSPTTGYLAAPATYLGDWSGLDGEGSIQYDHRNISGDPNRTGLHGVIIEGPGGRAQFTGTGEPPTVPSPWARVVVPLVESSWHVVSGTWHALLADVTEFRIRIELITGDDSSGMDNIRLVGADPCANPSPTIISMPVLIGQPDVEYQYDIQAIRPGGGSLTYGLVESPDGMIIDSGIGAVRWVPTSGQIGPHPVEVEVRDAPGNRDRQRYFVEVVDPSSDDMPPEVLLQIVDEGFALLGDEVNVVVGTTVEFRVNATDDIGVTARSLSLRGVDVPLDAQGRATMIMSDIGLYPVLATAYDAAGNEGTDLQNLRVYDPSDEHFPIVTIHAPAQDTILSMRAEVRVTIEDAVMESWTVDYARLDQIDPDALHAPNQAWINIGSGTESLTDEVVGLFDPTILLNDAYVIRAIGTNVNGRTQTRGVVVGVYSDLKLGEFRLEFTDLTIPVSGIPIEVKRVYDSRESTDEGDFGFGWSLGIQDARIREILGESTLGYRTMYPGTRVYINTPDGRRVGFTAYASSINCFGFCFATVDFRPDPGVYEKLAIAGSNVATVYDGFFLGGLASAPFDPNNYRLTMKNGTVYEYSQTAGLTRVTDLNGNRLDFTDQGIFHYESGAGAPDQSIAFTRDEQGRIATVVDPDGNELTYAYDEAGDLVSFTDQVGNTSQYGYHDDRPHYLETMIDPLGHPLIRTEFDDDGRVRSVTDALGNAVVEEFDLDANTGTFTDARGNVTISTYDERGNVVKIVGPEDGITEFQFDENNNEIWKKDPRGNVTELGYDARGNVTLVRNAALDETELTYNNQNRLTEVRDVISGIKTRFEYDLAGNLTGVRNTRDEEEAVIGRDGSGRVVSFMDRAGNTTGFSYAGGCPCGSPSRIDNPDGTFLELQYNSFGQVTQQTNGLGEMTEWAYDKTGRLISRRDPSGNLTTYSYTGNYRTSDVDPLGRTAVASYDAAGRMTQIADPLGGALVRDYDAAGNARSVKDPVLNETLRSYEGRNLLETETNALGLSRSYRYDEGGNLVEVTDRNGRRRVFDYDELNRRDREEWFDAEGASVRIIEYLYDELGRLYEIVDPVSTTVFGYNDLNQIETAVQSGLAGVGSMTMIYEYDAGGNVQSVSDDLGHTEESQYDDRNRLDQRAWAGSGAGAGIRLAYDGAGRLDEILRYSDAGLTLSAGSSVIQPNPLGGVASIVHEDALGNPLASFLYSRDAAQQVIGRTINSQVATFGYDARGQLTSAAYSDGQPSESFDFDDNGNRMGGTYVIDANNRLTSDGLYDYGYDGEGNLVVRTELATGNVTRYEYDHRNRMTQIVEEDSGGVQVALTEYAYDALNRRVRKVVNGVATQYVYNRGAIWADLDEAGSVLARYLSGDLVDQRFGRIRTGEAPEWYLTDALGTVHDVQGSDGTVLSHTTYSAFGEIIGQTGPMHADRFGFTGREHDTESGLLFLRARYYSPRLGRFMSEDPLGIGSGDANLSRYAFNSPQDLSDPLGLSALIGYAARVGRLIGKHTDIDAEYEYTPPSVEQYAGAMIGGLLGFGISNLMFAAEVLGDPTGDFRDLICRAEQGTNDIFSLYTGTGLDRTGIDDYDIPGRGFVDSFIGGLALPTYFELELFDFLEFKTLGVEFIGLDPNTGGFSGGARFGIARLKVLFGLYDLKCKDGVPQ